MPAMPETQEQSRRARRKARPPPEPPSKVTRYQVELAKRARETGMSLDEIAAHDAAERLAKERPQSEGIWFRFGKAPINGVSHCTLEKLVCSQGHISVERLHGPDIREVCLQRLAEELA